MVKKKPRTKLSASGSAIEAQVIVDGSNCTAFVQKTGLKPCFFDVFAFFALSIIQAFSYLTPDTFCCS